MRVLDPHPFYVFFYPFYVTSASNYNYYYNQLVHYLGAESNFFLCALYIVVVCDSKYSNVVTANW